MSAHNVVAVYRSHEYPNVTWHVDNNGTIIRKIAGVPRSTKILQVRTDENGKELLFAGMIAMHAGCSRRSAKITDNIVVERLKKFEKVQ